MLDTLTLEVFCLGLISGGSQHAVFQFRKKIVESHNYGKFILLEVVFLGLGRFMGVLTGFNIKAVLLVAKLFVYI